MRRHGASSHKIARIQTFHVRCALPEAFSRSQQRLTEREALLVHIETEGGAHGWGECGGLPAVAQVAIHSVYAPMLLGRDVLLTDVLWHEMWRATRVWARRGMLLAAMSGLDMALWDAKGHLLKQPVCELMGGRLRDTVPCYATGLYFQDRPEAERIPLLMEEAQHYIEAGYRAVKAQIGRNPSYDAAVLRALRRTLPDIPLLADAGYAYDLPEAISVGRILEEEKYSWFGEPLSPEYPEQLRQLADKIRVPIASGESEQTRWGFHALLAPGGVSIAQPDLSYCGGPSEAQRIRAVAGSMGINISPHTSGTMLNLAAALHFLASDYRQPGRLEPTLGFLNRDGSPNPLRDVLFSTTLDLEGGLARVPTASGLGVTVDEDEVQSFCVKMDETRAS